jgi:hypothetical protein
MDLLFTFVTDSLSFVSENDILLNKPLESFSSSRHFICMRENVKMSVPFRALGDTEKMAPQLIRRLSFV